MARVYVRSITRSTMYQKAPFCLPELAYGKYRSVACGFSSIKLDYSDYPKSFISRLNDVYGFPIEKKHKLHLSLCFATITFYIV